MKNPWEEINLRDYESHMKLETVMQLQAMNEIMRDQLCRYPAKTVMILGIAGGNGLNHVASVRPDKVYGVDINKEYLSECERRYPELKGTFFPIHCDLKNENAVLPQAELVIANLLIEYIGYENFQNAVKKTVPNYVSCVIQVNADSGFVSDSPYIHAFDRLNEVHRDIDGEELARTMEDIGFRVILKAEKALPNGKALLRLDFENK